MRIALLDKLTGQTMDNHLVHSRGGRIIYHILANH